MSNLIKIMLIGSPVIALVFWYTVMKQSQIDTQIKKADVEFEQKWNQFEADFTKDPVKKKEYEARADKSTKELEELKAEEKNKKAKADKFENEFDKQIEDFNKQKGKDFEKQFETEFDKELENFNKESGGEKK